MTRNDFYKSALLAATGTPAKLKEAYSFLIMASEDGDARADYALATWYIFGNEFIAVDKKKAFLLLRNLRNSFIAEAIFDLAVAYDLGTLTKTNEIKAFTYYMIAATLGHKESCYQIAQFYDEGLIVKRNSELVKFWKDRSKRDEKEISPPYRVWISPAEIIS